MNYIIRLGMLNSLDSLISVPDVDAEIVDEIALKAGPVKDAPRKWVQSKTGNVMALGFQEKNQPCTLEARVPGDEILSHA